MQRALKPLIRWEWVILIAFVPLLLLAAEAQIFLLVILLIFWLLRLAATGRLAPRTPFDLDLLALVLALLISLTAVFDWSLSLPKIAGLALGISLFYAAVYYMRRTPRGVWHVLAALILAGSALGAIGAAMLLVSPDFLGHIINPNEIGGVLAWIVPLLTAVTIGYSSRLWNAETWQLRILPLLLQGLLLLTIVTLLVTRSRGAIASVVLASLIMLLIHFRWARWLIPLLLIVGTVAFYLLGQEALANILVGDNTAVESLGLDSRLEIWSRGLYALSDFPYTGVSMNGFREVMHILYPLFGISSSVDLGHAHNHLLQAGLDLGILGLIAYLALWLGSAGLLWRALRISAVEKYRALLIGLAGALSAGWFFGILDAIALGARPGFLWWLILALLVYSCAPGRRIFHAAEIPEPPAGSAIQSRTGYPR